jgi:spermidine synthase
MDIETHEGTRESASAASTPLSPTQLAVLLVSVLIVALCGIAYELIIAAVSSYLLGNSIYQFSITIGLFMFAMGIGSYLTKRFDGDLVASFVTIELAVALVGGLCSTALFVVFPYYAWYKPVMYGLILVIGALVGLEIPLLTRILSEVRTLRTSIAHVLSLDYIGALIGSVAFPLLLLPHLGLFRSSFAIGLLNVGVVWFTLVTFRGRLPRPRLFELGAIVVTAALVVGLVYAEAIRRFAESRLFGHSIVFTKQTPYQRIILTQSERSGKLRLYIDGHLQFAEADEHRYHESLVHPVMALPGPRKNVLILGGGDGMAAREVFKYDDVDRVDLVDIDPAITTLCSTHGAIRRINRDALQHPKLHLHHTDAFNYVLDTERKYDRIIIDLPDPHNEALSKLYSVTFYKALIYCMTPNGYFVTQSSSPYNTRESYWCIAKTIDEAGMKPFSYHIAIPSFGIWGFHLAGADGKPVQESFRFTVPTQFLTTDVMIGATRFAADTSPVPVPANELFQPVIYRMYRKGENR